ncbi:hypothetical protein ABPG75_009676 [Micractinium tetrahymenae]
MGEAAEPREFVKVAAREDGWAVRLAEDGRLITVQELEEEANEIADLLTFKLAVDRGLPLSSVLLRVPGSNADFLQAEEGLRNLAWEEFLSNLMAMDEALAGDGAPAEAPAAEEAGGSPRGGATTAAAAAPTFASSSQPDAGGGVDDAAEHTGGAQQRPSPPPQPQQKDSSAARAAAQAAVAGAAAASGVAEGPATTFSPPAKLIGCYRQPANNRMLSVQVGIKDPATGKEKSTYFGGTYLVPEAAGMARDVARLWDQRQRGEPLERVNFNFPLSFYTNNAELMSTLVGAADLAALKTVVLARFMSTEGQQAAAAAVAAAGVAVPPPPPLGDAAPAPAGKTGSGGSGAAPKKSHWKVKPDGGAQKVMTANCQNALCITDQAWVAIFGPNVTAPRIQLQLASGQVFHVNVGQAPDRGHPLGRGWKEAAKAMQLQPGDTLVLRRAAGPGGSGGQAGGAGAAGAAAAAGNPTVLATVVRCSSSAAAAAAASAGTMERPASPGAAPSPAPGGRSGGGGGATPLAGRKRTAEESGLLRSPGGTIRQLCADKMLAAARAKQGAAAAAAAAAAARSEGAAAGAKQGAAATAAAAAAEAAPEPSPYELYCRMKPAVAACGLPAASRHAYFQAFLHMDRSTQRIHCEEVQDMAEEGLLDQLRQFLEAEVAARGAAAAPAAGGAGQTVSTLSGGTTSGLQGVGGGGEQRASSRP